MPILEEYLISLGFSSDNQAYQKFDQTLKYAQANVENRSLGIAGSMMKAQLGILGGFTAVSAGILGMAESAAQADQGYRLMGQRMLMTKDTARKLDIVTKALGVDLNAMIWDKQTGDRAKEMIDDLSRVGSGMGQGWEKDLEGISRVSFEFNRLWTITKTLGASQFSSRLFKDFGLDKSAGIATLDDLVTRLEDQIPLMANMAADHSAPILKSTLGMFEAAGGAVKDFGVLFTNTVGLITGDKSIQGAEFSFDKLGGAIVHVTDWMTDFFSSMSEAEQVVLHLSNGIVLFAENIKDKVFPDIMTFFDDRIKELENTEAFKKLDVLVHKFSSSTQNAIASGTKQLPAAKPGVSKEMALAALSYYPSNIVSKKVGDVASRTYHEFVPKAVEGEFKEAGKHLSPGATAILAGTAGFAIAGPAGAAAAMEAGGGFLSAATAASIAGTAGGAAAAAGAAAATKVLQKANPGIGSAAQDKPEGLIDFISRVLKDSESKNSKMQSVIGLLMKDAGPSGMFTNVPTEMALAVAKQESGFDPDRTSEKGAHGVMQLMPKTAKWLGVDINDLADNIKGGEDYLSRLMKKYSGDQREALSAYNAGPDTVDRAIKAFGADYFSHLPKETQDYVPKVLGYERDYSDALARLDRPNIPAGYQAPSVGGKTEVNVTVQQTFGDINAGSSDPRDVRSAVGDGAKEGVHEAIKSQSQIDAIQFQATW